MIQPGCDPAGGRHPFASWAYTINHKNSSVHSQPLWYGRGATPQEDGIPRRPDSAATGSGHGDDPVFSRTSAAGARGTAHRGGSGAGAAGASNSHTGAAAGVGARRMEGAAVPLSRSSSGSSLQVSRFFTIKSLCRAYLKTLPS